MENIFSISILNGYNLLEINQHYYQGPVFSIFFLLTRIHFFSTTFAEIQYTVNCLSSLINLYFTSVLNNSFVGWKFPYYLLHPFCILNILFFHVLVISFVREKWMCSWRFFSRWVIFSIGPYSTVLGVSMFFKHLDAMVFEYTASNEMCFFVLRSGFVVIQRNSKILSLSIAPLPIFYVHLLENLLGTRRNLLLYPLLLNLFLIFPINLFFIVAMHPRISSQLFSNTLLDIRLIYLAYCLSRVF